MKNVVILLFSLFASKCISAQTGINKAVNKGCKIDSIHFKSYSLAYIYEKKAFKDADSLFMFGNPEKNWREIYNDNKIVLRFLGNTFGGQNRIEKFQYDNGLLTSIKDNISVSNEITFEYDKDARPIKINKSSNFIGKRIYFLKYENDTSLIFSTFNSDLEKIDEVKINLSEAHRKLCHKFGNINIFDDAYNIKYNDDEDYSQYYDKSITFDDCGNVSRVVERSLETGYIINAKFYNYFYH